MIIDDIDELKKKINKAPVKSLISSYIYDGLLFEKQEYDIWDSGYSGLDVYGYNKSCRGLQLLMFYKLILFSKN